MKVQIKPKRKKYTHSDIQSMLRDKIRFSNPYSYLHPQISPLGQSFHEDDDSLGIVADAKSRYIKNGWMPNRKVSEAAATKRDITALMSLEGTLTAAVHNAIQGYDMFDAKSGREHLKGMREIAQEQLADDDEKDQDPDPLAEQVERYQELDAGLAKHGLTEMAQQNLTSTESEIHLAAHQTGVAREAAESILPPGVSGIVSDLATVDPPTPEPSPPAAPPIPQSTPPPAKKTRNTKKKQYRKELDAKGVKWKKSWNTGKLKEKLDAHNIQ